MMMKKSRPGQGTRAGSGAGSGSRAGSGQGARPGQGPRPGQGQERRLYQPRPSFGGERRDGARGGESSTSFAPTPRIGAEERLIYGTGPVRELLAAKPGAVRRLFVEPRRGDQASDDVGQLLARARELGLPTEMAEKAVLSAIAGEFALHQGVIAVVAPFVFAELSDIIERAAERSEPLLVVVLDQVQDPHNVGAIIRTAYLMGAHGVVVPVHRQSSITATVTKASAGATELMPIAQVTNVTRALEEFKAAGAWIVGLDAPAKMRLSQVDGTLPLVLVSGAEGDGIRPLVAKHCDFLVELPMHASGVGSYNVSVATAMALYEITRGRHA